MDYGQPNQNEVNQPFSMEGFSSADLENAKFGGAEADPSRDQNQNFGKNAINGQLVENEYPVEANAMGDFGPAAEPLGQIIDVEPAMPTTDIAPAFDQSVIRINGESLDNRAIEVISDMEKTLGKTGDAASFVANFEEAKIANLKNSYNRTFGESA